MTFRNCFFIFLLSLLSISIDAQCVSGNCIDGVGTYVYPSGARYTGHFVDGEIHGIGKCVYSDGTVYQGEWAHRYPEGKGTKIYSDGTRHKGLWKKGKPVDADGNVLEEYIAKREEEQVDDGTNIQSGCLSGDCKNGQGIYAYPDGSKYEGNFEHGKLRGQGKWFFPNGDKYVGAFKDNYPNGKGTLFHSDGRKQTGEWRDGEFFGSSLVDGGKIGCIKGDCQNGEGTYIYKEGSAKYTGTFKDGQPEGFGVCVFSNGDRYRGQWVAGGFEGKGTLRMQDGTSVVGYWKGGQFVGTDMPEEPAHEAAVADTDEADPVEPPTKEELPKSKVWAVVVGVASYDHMPVLRYTDDDAYRFYAFLKSLEGGALPDRQIRILIDEEATRSNILEALNGIFSQAAENDVVLFYFSGHGLNGSFLPIDFDGYNNKLLHTDVAEVFQKTKAKYKLCLADACHSGSILAMRSGEVETTLSKYYKTLSKSIGGTALLMSSKSDETSLESSGLRQGVFSHFLIRGLKGEADEDKNRIISIQELYDFVYKNVRTYTGNRQSPLIKGTYDPRMPVGILRYQ